MIAATINLSSLQRRFDLSAVGQLRNECARLVAENDELRTQLRWAEDSAESWRRDATEMHLQLCEQLVGSPGITIDGRLVVANGGAK